MIPIRDTIPSRRFPLVTIALIAGNVAVFVYELSLGEKLPAFTTEYGVRPAHVMAAVGAHAYLDAGIPFFTAMFLHGGWIHLLGNMLYLWIFGDNVEDTMGHQRFLLFYVLSGLAAGAAQVYVNPASDVPMVGASGAIAGVLGGYILLFPRSRVLTLVPIFIFITFMEIPAIVFLGLWFLMQFLSGTLALSAETTATGGVAWWAHVGGFATGVVLVFPMRKYR